MTGWVTMLLALGAAPSGQLAYTAGTEQDDQRVYVMDVATSQSIPVGPGTGDGAPVWSPDGTWLAFETRRNGGLGIRIVRPDGTESADLTHAANWNRYPHWAPDSRRLVYRANDDSGMGGKCVVYDLDAGTETVWGGEQAQILQAAWLPNMKLLYALRPDQEIQAEGSQESTTLIQWLEKGNILAGIGLKQDKGVTTSVCLLSSDMLAELPDWVYKDNVNYIEWMVEPSPTGEGVAFESNDGGDREIFVLTRKGLVDVSNHRAADWHPVWSPDGEWVAFESFRDGRRGIYRAYPDTARVTPVAVSGDSDNWWPTWSPDGNWLAFVSTRAGQPQIFITDLHGENVKQATVSEGYALAPSWSPRKK